ncbi:3',5'-cyclic adenosine monophosphate phosphodiesterase CpdA [Ferriphaselus amnicola]|uniref:3',5'-cyclic adenosine monophosphate phosphodiesterase CpdA n=1 Tax=Ferriphaselus amnicola TaxID=1188319 RepID=A0A2Z6GEJ3_9PROT|nr:metallophosphoesterase family protein [Ferriphaselus amnicola]BBE51988.1 3',5'-cyclic adenosine monophosphate phosphodiesterase CpdA [Ferriphaselus amnicola]
MKLHVLSDIHLEFSSFVPPETDADVVILAGDVGKLAGGMYWAARTFAGKRIIYVAGNHEFYGTQRRETVSQLHIASQATGVHLLDDAEVIIDGVRFLGSTLWTDFMLFGADERPYAMRDGMNCLNDFRGAISEGVMTFSPADSVKLHEQSLGWLETKLAEPFDGKTVVVTHHLPSMLSVAERYQSKLLSACFASHLDHLFGKMDVWIHGHTHDSFDYHTHDTRVVCNPRGYVTYRGAENFDFNPGLVIEI